MLPFRPLGSVVRTLMLGLAAVAVGACKDSSAPPDTPQPPGQIVVRTQPTGATVGAPLSIQPVVELQDCWNRLVDSTGVVVTASIASGTATIKSGAEAVSVNGIAEFKDLVIVGRTDAPVVLRFSIRHRSGTGTTVKSSQSIMLQPGPATAVQPIGQTTYTGAVGTAVTPAPSVTVLDAGQNPVAGARVTFTVLQGAGRLTDSVATSDANGIARLGSWSLGLPGVNRIAARLNDTVQTVFTAAATGQIGTLRIRVTNRPDAQAVPIRVRRTSVGSPAFDDTVHVTDTLTLTGIPFGQYSVVGDSVVRGSRIWLPRASFSNLTVSETSGPDVNIEYVEYGRVEMTVRGLPGGNTEVPLAVVQQDTTNGVQGTITARNDVVTRALLPLGRFEVIAPSLVVGGQRFTPTPEKQIITVRSGETAAAVAVNYAIATGNLVVSVTGLPAGATASVDISGPGGFRETVFMTGNRIYTGLAAGTYTVTASSVTAGGRTYTPDASSRTATVIAGESVTTSFVYTAP